MKCYCGSNKELNECCELIHNGQKAQSAEELLRSRYSAFTTQNIDYIKKTIHPSQLHEFDEKGIREWSEKSEWLGLEIHQVENKSDIETQIDFTATYKIGGQTHKHRELSTFKKEKEEWFFFDGHFVNNAPIKRSEPKIGRNDPCSCGSGKKFKKCCGADE